ncbi:GntR family transcriptional regulator [Streptomyces sp. NPDC058045]|uniref:GntR family transcriptional regulator n=1 Tax=Streptomyces sp. NPDC058045 TaxID=3346311 RepID=UPI0036EE20D8
MAVRSIHVARHARIADELRHRITNGNLTAGDQLPPESDLIKQYETSRQTVREALAALENEGLIVRRHGRGNFVRPSSGHTTYTPNARGPEPQTTTTVALDTTVTTNSTPADAELAALLDVRPGTRLTEYTYLSSYADHPHSLARVYVPDDIAKRLAVPGTGTSPTSDDISAQLTAAGIKFAEVTTRVTARLPEPEDTWVLRIGAGAPVLSIQRTSRDTDGRVVEAALLLLPGHSAEALFTTHPAAAGVRPEG